MIKRRGRSAAQTAASKKNLEKARARRKSKKEIVGTKNVLGQNRVKALTIKNIEDSNVGKKAKGPKVSNRRRGGAVTTVRKKNVVKRGRSR